MPPFGVVKLKQRNFFNFPQNSFPTATGKCEILTISNIRYKGKTRKKHTKNVRFHQWKQKNMAYYDNSSNNYDRNTFTKGNAGDHASVADNRTGADRRGRANPVQLTPWLVASAIPDSIGSIDEIARRVGAPRIEVRRFINANKELREALDDELLAAQERLIMQTYADAMDGGSPQSRESFFKMINGYFEKKESEKNKSKQAQIVIQMQPPEQKFKVLGDGGDVIEMERRQIMGKSADKFVLDGDVDDDADNDSDNGDDGDDDV